MENYPNLHQGRGRYVSFLPKGKKEKCVIRKRERVFLRQAEKKGGVATYSGSPLAEANGEKSITIYT